jgi:hypothetical protein
MLFYMCALSLFWCELFLRSVSLGQGVVLSSSVPASVKYFHSLSFA